MLQTFVSIFSLVVSLMAISLSIYFWSKTRKQDKEITDNIRDNHNLISSTTELLTVSERIGIKAAYENRLIALQNFKMRFMEEDKLIVIGSSLKGLRMYVPEFDKILKARASEGLENRFLLTHPCYSTFREEKEFRESGDIKKEIDGTLSFLTNNGVKEDEVRLYLGTPTNFTVITRNSMLINPYPYQVESFRCFCLEVERKEIQDVSEEIKRALFPAKKDSSDENLFHSQPLQEKGAEYLKLIDKNRWSDFIKELKVNADHDYTYDIADDIYGQFYWYHYLLPWYSRFSIGLSHYRQQCQEEIDECIKKRSQIGCKLLEGSSIRDHDMPVQLINQAKSS